MPHSALIFKSVFCGKTLWQIWRLYRSAFPKNERIPFLCLLFGGFSDKNVHFKAIFDEDRFIGLIYFIVDSMSGYVAIEPYSQSKGYGTQMLVKVRSDFPDFQIILNIEPPDLMVENAGQRQKRFRFYQKQGFIRLPYDLVIEQQPFWILSTAERLEKTAVQAVFARFIDIPFSIQELK